MSPLADNKMVGNLKCWNKPNFWAISVKFKVRKFQNEYFSKLKINLEHGATYFMLTLSKRRTDECVLIYHDQSALKISN